MGMSIFLLWAERSFITNRRKRGVFLIIETIMSILSSAQRPRANFGVIRLISTCSFELHKFCSYS
ncbi:unnamed protein product [Meloidogyne enterolobii]|uniref:Uncharacterized protein n=1 Tax=Meloidogyne enterolobii TaxID=390850 RepID=A0ACB1AII9_MELEN